MPSDLTINPTNSIGAGAPGSVALSCGCIDLINDSLAAQNGRLCLTFAFTTGGVWPTIMVEKIKPRGPKPPLAIPTYCPFCGKPYHSSSALSAERPIGADDPIERYPDGAEPEDGSK